MIKVGQLVEIKGAKNHVLKHPWSFKCGHNLFCTDDTPGAQRFIGLGIEGSEKEICQQLLNEYNSSHTWDSKPNELKVSETEELVQEFSEDTQESLDPKNEEGFNPGSAQDFNIDLIQDLIDLPIEKVNMDFVKNHPSNNTKLLEAKDDKLVQKIKNEK